MEKKADKDRQSTIYEHTVPDGQHTDIRLDKYITSFVENASRTKVQEAISDGYVSVNGNQEKNSYIM
ncbi:MAG TPA: RNA pseudouridine synthase, partial [Balneolaceae bacterium]|nr:RNA pseudouridine synthase [Balneolaceae bacterium]